MCRLFCREGTQSLPAEHTFQGRFLKNGSSQTCLRIVTCLTTSWRATMPRVKILLNIPEADISQIFGTMEAFVDMSPIHPGNQFPAVILGCVYISYIIGLARKFVWVSIT